jgi:LysR family cys regulon transcriptional activator
LHRRSDRGAALAIGRALAKAPSLAGRRLGAAARPGSRESRLGLAIPAAEDSRSDGRLLLSGPEQLRLEEVAQHPLITYSPEFAGRSHIDEAFTARGLRPDIVLAAVDSDVIKSYVELGLGVGIIAAMAFDAARDRALRAIDAGHLFGTNTTRIAVRRGAYLRGYVYDFIERFAPQLTRKAVDQAMAGAGETYEL